MRYSDWIWELETHRRYVEECVLNLIWILFYGYKTHEMRCVNRVHADSPFSLITSIRISITINVPVRPIPALKKMTVLGLTCFHRAHLQWVLQRIYGSFLSAFDIACMCTCMYLQCTAIGPASSMLSCFRLTSSKKSSTPPGSVGTPWSGQALKWYCQTVRSVLPWKHTSQEQLWPYSKLQNNSPTV